MRADGVVGAGGVFLPFLSKIVGVTRLTDFGSIFYAFAGLSEGDLVVFWPTLRDVAGASGAASAKPKPKPSDGLALSDFCRTDILAEACFYLSASLAASFASALAMRFFSSAAAIAASLAFWTSRFLFSSACWANLTFCASALAFSTSCLAFFLSASFFALSLAASAFSRSAALRADSAFFAASFLARSASN